MTSRFATACKHPCFKARLIRLQLTLPGRLSIRPDHEHELAPPSSSRMTRRRGANRSGCAS